MEKRRKVVSVKFSEPELELIDEYAYKTKMKRSTYIRITSLGIIPKEKPPKEFYSVLKELRYISNSINQIALKTNTKDYIDEPKYRMESERLNDLILEIKRKYLGYERK